MDSFEKIWEYTTDIDKGQKLLNNTGVGLYKDLRASEIGTFCLISSNIEREN
jgi:hypothetical protein